MSTFFNIKRFGNYLAYDLNKAFSTYGLSALISGLIPVIMFVFYELFSLTLKQSLLPMPAAARFVAFLIVSAIFMISAPTKIYGSITDKRAGSDWLMMPVSSFERFLSMMLILCIILPSTFFVLFFGSDFLLSVIAPVNYGDTVFYNGIKEILSYLSSSEFNDAVTLSPACFIIPWLEWCTATLTFALGAIWFKERKVAKTILVCLGIGIVFSLFVALLSNFISLDSFEYLDKLTPLFMQRMINLAINLRYILSFSILLLLIYLRIRTLKH